MTRTWVTWLTSNPGVPASSSRSKGVPGDAPPYFPAKLCSLVGSSVEKTSCGDSGRRVTAGKRKKLVPSELTSTNANSFQEFSKTAKSCPAPFLMGLSNVRVACPPSPRHTSPTIGFSSILLGSPNVASPLDGSSILWKPRTTSIPVGQAIKLGSLYAIASLSGYGPSSAYTGGAYKNNDAARKLISMCIHARARFMLYIPLMLYIPPYHE